MNIRHPASKIWTTDEFLRWGEGQDGKYELVQGRVVDMMVRVTRSHIRLTTNLTLALCARLSLDTYDVGSADFGVKVSEQGIRYPDVFVDRASDSQGSDLAARAPVFLAEVLSPSSVARDFGPKALEYTALPTLLHYLVLATDQPRVWLWSRGSEGTFGEPALVEGVDQAVDLSGFGIVLPLADLYRGIA